MKGSEVESQGGSGISMVSPSSNSFSKLRKKNDLTFFTALRPFFEASLLSIQRSQTENRQLSEECLVAALLMRLSFATTNNTP